MLFGVTALITIESPAIIGTGAKKSNKNDVFVPTVSAVDVSKFGIFVFETAVTLQLLWSIDDPPEDKVVTVKLFPVFVVEGDNIFVIEKETVLPAGAELLKQFDKETCWLNGKQLRVEFNKVPADNLAQTWVRLDITGVYELLGAPLQVDGNWTVIDPFASIAFPIVIVIEIVEVEWTILGLKLEVQLCNDPVVYPL